MMRLPDWRSRLHQYLCIARTRPLQPGRHDCCLFGAGAVEAMTGVDLAAPYRGRYTTYAGGRRVLRRDGYADHMALIAAHLLLVVIGGRKPSASRAVVANPFL